MAVYTDVSPKDLEAFLKAYQLGNLLNYHGIAQGVENSNFFVKTDKLSCILTLFEKRVSLKELPFFLELMRHLNEMGIPCPLPINRLDGAKIGILHNKPATFVSFLEGKASGEITQNHCYQLGQTMAQMHLAGLNFPQKRANNMGLKTFSTLYRHIENKAQKDFANVGNILEQEIYWLEKNWPHELPKGIIHADLFPDNVFFKDNRLCGIIDFYFAAYDSLTLDLAITLNAWCFDEEAQFNLSYAKALFRGYETVRPLSPAERMTFPILARGAAVRFLLSRLYDWLNPIKDAIVTPKNPLEYFQYLRFHQQSKGAQTYGLTKVH